MDRHDVVIAGTGAGGGTLDHRLAPSGKCVPLLELGGLDRHASRCIRCSTCDGHPGAKVLRLETGPSGREVTGVVVEHPPGRGRPLERHGPVRQRPATSAPDVSCRARETDDIFVVHAGLFPSSGAVDPALTVMANALRMGDHLIGRLP